jgi:hypothetical protein
LPAMKKLRIVSLGFRMEIAHGPLRDARRFHPTRL